MPRLSSAITRFICGIAARRNRYDALCLTNTLPAAGFTLTGQEDWSGEILALLADLRGKLALAQWAGAASSMADDWAGIAPGLLERVDGLVRQGQIGYWLYTARNEA